MNVSVFSYSLAQTFQLSRSNNLDVILTLQSAFDLTLIFVPVWIALLFKKCLN